MNEAYNKFITDKTSLSQGSGFSVSLTSLNKILFVWQKLFVQWALLKGCAALFEECGMGKTLQQLEWAIQVIKYTGKKVIIVCPLAVADQTLREFAKLKSKISISFDRTGTVSTQIIITNYEQLNKFHPVAFGGIVLDESSILKNHTGAYRNFITEFASTIKYRLCCTATPSPNDYMELGTHAEFLGICKRSEMLSTYFKHDSVNTSQWRIKSHAFEVFWKWVASWAVAVRKPEDIGYKSNYALPLLNYHHQIVGEGGVNALTLSDRRLARKGSKNFRVILMSLLLFGWTIIMKAMN